jgi:hypothetical protein
MLMGKRTFVAAVVIAVIGSVGFASAAFAGGGGRHFEANLRGDKEAPGPGDPDGRGHADVKIKAKAGKVCFDVHWNDIATPTLGHIHAGKAGVAGPVVVDLLGGATPDELEEDNDYRNCVSADPALLAQIASHPRQYYVNIHNPRFPAGAIRGQLHA